MVTKNQFTKHIAWVFKANGILAQTFEDADHEVDDLLGSGANNDIFSGCMNAPGLVDIFSNLLPKDFFPLEVRFCQKFVAIINESIAQAFPPFHKIKAVLVINVDIGAR